MLIKNFIDQNKCNQLIKILEKSEYRTHEMDPQITNETTRAYLAALWKFNFSMTERVSEIFKKELIPSGDYSRMYTKGSELKPHDDANHCEYSLTINLLNIPESKRWPFYVKTNSDVTEYLMGPGDAVFYYGILQKHWREELVYDKCYQTFLHYVDVNGSNAHLGYKNYKDLL